MSKDVAEEFNSSLADLTINSKPLINMLTMLAEDYIEHAPIIVMAVEAHLQKVRGDMKLPALYLIDSIVKNVGQKYVPLFTQNIVSTFCSVFEKVDEKVRAQMFKLRQTWNDYFPPKKLYALDARVHTIDPAWPITAPPPSSNSIHVNPKFLQVTTPSPPDTATPGNIVGDGGVREQLLKRQKELLELQKRKVELELLQTRAILEEQQKKLENHTATLKPTEATTKSSQKADSAVPFHTKTSEYTVGQCDSQIPPKVEGVGVVSGGVRPTGRIAQINNGPGNVALPYLNSRPTNDVKTTLPQVTKSSECNANDSTNMNKVGISIRSRDPRIRRKEKNFEKKPQKIEKITDAPILPEIAEIPNVLPDNQLSPIQPSIIDSVSHKSKKEGRRKKNTCKRKQKPISGELKEGINFENSNIQDLFDSEGNLKGDKRFKTEKESKSSSDKPKSVYVIKKQIKPNIVDKTNTEGASKRPSSASGQSLNDFIMKKSKHTKTNSQVVYIDVSGTPSLPIGIPSLSNSAEIQKIEKRKLGITEGSSDPKKLCSVDVIGEPTEIKSLPISPSSSTSSIKSKHSSIARLQKYNRDSPDMSPLSTSSSITTSKSDEISDKDVDLRLLPSPSSKRSSDCDSPSPKKSKAEIIDRLFGNEDVDLRTLTPHPPTPPPPPIISGSPESPEKALSEKSWAIFKQSKSEGKSEEKRSRQAKERVSIARALFPHKKGEEQEKDTESEDCSNANCNLIIRQAEEQLSTGNITFNQYNRMLKEVISINEEMKLKEAQRKDELESSDTSDQLMKPTDGEPEEPEKRESIVRVEESKEDVEPSVGVGKEPSIEEWAGETENWEKKTPEEKKLERDNRFHLDVPDRSHETLLEIEARKFVEKSHFQSKNIHRTIESDRNSYYEPTMGKNMKPMHPPIRQWMINVPPPSMNMCPVHPPDMAKYQRWPMPGPQRPVFPEHPPQYYPTTRSVHPKPRYSHHREPRDVPPADPLVLDSIARDTMHTINIDGIPREVRFYGETAVIMLSWDDPREITFQPGSRRIIIDELDAFVLMFNHPYREFLIDGRRIKMRLGAPTRELYVDGHFYEVIFGGPPLQIMMGNRLHTVKLEGPSPQVRIGTVKRTDLVAGKINLIVDAKQMFSLFLDAKPQRFDIDGIPYILRFVEALRTIVINGRPFKIEFGGLPVPIFFRGVKHYLRLSVLPHGIKPGHITIVNMEGGRLPTPPPSPPAPLITPSKPRLEERFAGIREMPAPNIPDPTIGALQHAYNTHQAGNEQPLELLTSLMPAPMAPSTGQSYTVEQSSDETTNNAAPPNPAQNNSLINVGELYQKLVAIGIVPAATKEKEQPVEDTETIRPVDFSQSETLKNKQPGLVKRLYTGIQCSSCGVRFSPEETVKYSQHLDWHFRQNRRERDSTKVAQSRKWYYDVSDWIQYQEIEDVEERAQSWFESQDRKSPTLKEDILEDEPSVAAGDQGDNVSCVICQDKFEQFYNEEKEEWHLRKAIRIDDKVYHPLCYQDFKESESRRANLEIVAENVDDFRRMEEELETIELDDTVNEIEEITPVVQETVVIDDNQSIDSENDSVPESEDMIFANNKGTNDIGKKKNEDSNKDHSGVGEGANIEEDDDDDILQVEVLERKIESYEILDDDEEEDQLLFKKLETDETFKLDDDDKDLDDLDEIDFSKVTVKKEKLDFPEPVVDTTHTSVTATIDGNVEFEEAPPPIVTGKIKINISKAIPIRTNRDSITKDQQENNFRVPSSGKASVLAFVEQNQPPPPGEELCPARLKPKLVGTKLIEVTPVKKGNELSGLCSIM